MMQAKQVRIGDEYVTRKGKNVEAHPVKRLHELCAQRRTPHVHLVHSSGALCLGFNAMVDVRRGGRR
jgi:hypothetical protein